MKLPLLNIDGSKSSSIEISDKLINLKANQVFIKFVIDWQQYQNKSCQNKTKKPNQRINKKNSSSKGRVEFRH